MTERIEVLGPRLLDSERRAVAQVKELSRSLRVALGWHYLLDIPWLLRQFPKRDGLRFLDAGAGIGVIQWHLAEDGANVLSVDRTDRSKLSLRFRTRYDIRGYVEGDLGSILSSAVSDVHKAALVVDAPRYVRDAARRLRGRRAKGTVSIHRANLAALEEVADSSIDHVVAVSALEHNDPSALAGVVQELWRVLRPGGTLAATVGASGTDDWFHEPSRGWCYSEATVRDMFGLSPDTPSNYDRYDDILAETVRSGELRKNLPAAYARSGSNGMPWGKWDPKYLSVGIRRDKPADQPGADMP